MSHYKSSAEGMPRSLSRATDIPQELFENVLSRAAESKHAMVPSKSNDVRNLCSLALVSRYFASICRPHLFKNLWPKNPQHMRGLLTLINTSPTTLPSLATHIRYVFISSASTNDHWIHQVSMALLPQVKKHSNQIPDMRLWTSNRIDTVPRRSVIRLTSRYITDLTLYELSFTRGEDLLRFLSAFPVVQTIHLSSVTCNATIQNPSVVPTIPCIISLRRISVTCFLCRQWLALWMLCGCSGRIATLMLQWTVADLADFVAVASVLPIGRGVNLKRSHDDSLEIDQMEGDHQASISLSSLLDGDNLARRTPNITYQRWGRDLRGDAIPVEWWKAIVKATAESSGLGEIPFEFNEKSDLENFVIAAHTTLKELCGGKRLIYNYDYWVGENRRIIRVDPDAMLKKIALGEYIAIEIMLEVDKPSPAVRLHRMTSHWYAVAGHQCGTPMCSQVDRGPIAGGLY